MWPGQHLEIRKCHLRHLLNQDTELSLFNSGRIEWLNMLPTVSHSLSPSPQQSQIVTTNLPPALHTMLSTCAAVGGHYKDFQRVGRLSFFVNVQATTNKRITPLYLCVYLLMVTPFSTSSLFLFLLSLIRNLGACGGEEETGQKKRLEGERTGHPLQAAHNSS